MAVLAAFRLPHHGAAARVGNIEQLRDRFAMAAMQGDLAAEAPDFLTTDDPSKDGVWTVEGKTKTRQQKIAENAYLIADAMLAARGRRHELET